VRCVSAKAKLNSHNIKDDIRHIATGGGDMLVAIYFIKMNDTLWSIGGKSSVYK